MSEKIKEQIIKLVADLNDWNQQYFDHHQSAVSDQVYDAHLKKLIELEKKYPQYILSDSPTQKIGATLNNKFVKVEHKKAMLSLNKAYTINELNKFINDLEQKIQPNSKQKINFIIQPKIDGLSIALHYKNGKLVQALTRGDGKIGEDVTNNIFGLIADIPTEIACQDELEVRGEIYLSKSMFNLINQQEQTNYANPRNLASGTLRQLDQSIIKRRKLSAFIYDIVDYQSHQINTQEQVWNFLEQQGFPILEHIKLINEETEIKTFIEQIEQIRKDLEYDIDGLVFKLNQVDYYDQIGYTNKFPKYAIAYKFADEVIDTILEDIFITIGRTGIVTYNAKLKPVQLGGTIISAATLHNYNYIEDLKLNLNDEVSIKKAGEIIPKVVALKKKNSIGVFAKILTCPACKQTLIDTKTLNNQVCLNYECSEINIRKIVHFASRQALNIEGLAEGIVSKFYQLGFLKKIDDIFKLNQFADQIINHKGFGPKFWSNLWNAINQAKNTSLEALIFGLGIGQLGTKGAKIIAQEAQNLEGLLNLDYEQLNAIKDIGPITIDAIKTYLNHQDNINLIKNLIDFGINPQALKTNKDVNNFFYNKTFVISGTLSRPRQEVIDELEKRGAKISSSISKNTFALIVGENIGKAKITKAKELNIELIDENKLIELLKN